MKLFVLTFLLSFNSFAVTEVMYAKYGAADRDLNSMPYVRKAHEGAGGPSGRQQENY
jgi:hypothetical protein